MRNKIFILVLMVFFLLPNLAAAANPCSTAEGGGNLGQCISKVYVWSLGLAALLALLMIIFGGYLVMTASGNGEQSSRGKSYITSSMIGLALLLGAYLILNTINPDLVKFNFKALETQSTVPRQ